MHLRVFHCFPIQRILIINAFSRKWLLSLISYRSVPSLKGFTYLINSSIPHIIGSLFLTQNKELQEQQASQLRKQYLKTNTKARNIRDVNSTTNNTKHSPHLIAHHRNSGNLISGTQKKFYLTNHGAPMKNNGSYFNFFIQSIAQCC